MSLVSFAMTALVYDTATAPDTEIFKKGWGENFQL